MSDLKFHEKKVFEKLFKMEHGFVLDLSDKEFTEFFKDYEIPIDSEKYHAKGPSKANRLRTLWEIESNDVVVKVNRGLFTYLSMENNVNRLFRQAENILSNLEKLDSKIRFKGVKNIDLPPKPVSVLKQFVQAGAHKYWQKDRTLTQRDFREKRV